MAEIGICPACGSQTGLRFVSQSSIGISDQDARHVVRRCMTCGWEWPLGNADAGNGRTRIDKHRESDGGGQA